MRLSQDSRIFYFRNTGMVRGKMYTVGITARLISFS